MFVSVQHVIGCQPGTLHAISVLAEVGNKIYPEADEAEDSGPINCKIPSEALRGPCTDYVIICFCRLCKSEIF